MAKKAKKNKSRKKTGEEDEKKLIGLSQETKNGIWGVISFGAMILSVLAFLGKAGAGGDFFAVVSKSFFGWGIFLIPVAFLILGISFIKSFEKKIYRSAILGTLLFVLSFLAVFYIIGSGDTSIRIGQGGYLGLALGYPLFRAMGFLSSFIILVMLVFVSFLIALDISFHKLITIFKKEENDEGENDENTQEISTKDNIVIKQGTRIMSKEDISAQTTKETLAKAVSKVVSPAKKEEDKEFIVKTHSLGNWTLPPIEILHSDKEQPRFGDINANAAIIKRTLGNFGIDTEMGEISVGPTVTQFTLRPAVGVKLSKIIALKSDLSLALAAHPLRIEAPIPGKSLVGVEVPNKKSALVGLRDIIESEDFRASKFFLPMGIGRDVAGFPAVAGLERMPHMLIAGATGTGKSVAINTVLLSLLYRHSPDMLKLILVDPKRVELSLYNGIPHLITPVIVDSKKVINALRWSVNEMERRYETLSSSGSRDIFSHNTKQINAKKDPMPLIIKVGDKILPGL